jgi:hypothetical protein
MFPAKYNPAMPAESTGNTGHDYSRVYHDTSDNCRQYFKLLPVVPDDLCLRQKDRQKICSIIDKYDYYSEFFRLVILVILVILVQFKSRLFRDADSLIKLEYK